MNVRRTILIAAALLAALSGFAEGRKRDAPELREKVKKRIEMMMLWRVAEVMELPPDKEARLMDVMKSNFEKREDLAKRHFEALERLKDGYERGAGDAELVEMMDGIDKVHAERAKTDFELRDGLKKFLGAKEMARFIIVWPEVEQEVRRVIADMGREGVPDRGPLMRRGK
ncbi:MAG: hypothetical protein AB1742_05710 [bacterium]